MAVHTSDHNRHLFRSDDHGLDHSELGATTNSQHHLGMSYLTTNKVLLVRQPLRFSQIAIHQRDRPLIFNALISSIPGLLDNTTSPVTIQEAKPCTIDELREYCTVEYLASLANAPLLSPSQLSRFGLEDDCSPFPQVLEYSRLSVGGSIQAASGLVDGSGCHMALHFDGGGRHHATKSKASGLCYINDIVIAISSKLFQKYQRILYIDVDIHHGDGVEQAFLSTHRVCTLSIHHASPGYFPGTGTTSDFDNLALNVPLEEGLRDDLFVDAFSTLVDGVVEVYKPECIVLCCGADGLAHDPIGKAWCLTPRAFLDVGRHLRHVSIAHSTRIPLLVLGGGGYNSVATACAWTALFAGLVDFPLHEMGDDVSTECPYFDRFGPTYQILAKPPSLRMDENDREGVKSMCHEVVEGLSHVVMNSEKHRNEHRNERFVKRMKK